MAENNMIEVGRLTYAKGHLVGALSGLATAALIGVADNLFALRNLVSEEIIVDSIDATWFTEVAFTTAQPVVLQALKVGGFTSITAGGSANSAKRKRVTDHDVIPASDLTLTMFTGAAVLGSGTFVADGAPFAVSRGESSLFPVSWLHWDPRGNIPITIGFQEGIIIRAQNAHGAAGQGRLHVAMDIRRA